jgi:hypothetical protein
VEKAKLLHTVAELPGYIRDADDAGLDEAARTAIVDTLAADPMQGAEVKGTGGVRKVRIAGKGKGKSGGYRVMTAYVGEGAPVYLVALLDKGDRDNFSKAERNTMKSLVGILKATWRKMRKTR